MNETNPNTHTEEIRAPNVLSQHTIAKVADVLVAAGSLLLIVGAFLPWFKQGVLRLGVEAAFSGPVTCLVGVLFLAALVLARSGTAGKWGAVMALLSAVPLALLAQKLYVYYDYHAFSQLAYGFWVALAGAIVVTYGSLIEFYRQSRGVIASE
jgi:hypothetical protein